MPLTDNLGQGVPYAVLTDAPNAQTLAEAIVSAVVGQLNMRFNSANHRAAVVTSPVEGMVSWLRDVGLFQVYDGSTWTTVATGTIPWTSLTLATGYTHNGNANGNVQYKVLNISGTPMMVMRGGMNLSYSGGSLVNGGVFTDSALPTSARPETLRTLAVACSDISSNRSSVKMAAQTDGHLKLTIESPNTPPWVSLNGVVYSL